jgi:hypothetical protein
MERIRLSAMEVKRDLFKLIRLVRDENLIIEILLNGEVVAEIVPKRVKPKKNFYEFVMSLPKMKGLTQKQAAKNYDDHMMKKYGKYL